MIGKVGNALSTIVNVIVIAIAAAFLVRPGGLLRELVKRQLHSVQLRRDWPSLTISGSRIDSGSGQVLLVVFSDYQCPYCRTAHNELMSLLDEFPNVGVAHMLIPDHHER